ERDVDDGGVAVREVADGGDHLRVGIELVERRRAVREHLRDARRRAPAPDVGVDDAAPFAPRPAAAARRPPGGAPRPAGARRGRGARAGAPEGVAGAAGRAAEEKSEDTEVQRAHASLSRISRENEGFSTAPAGAPRARWTPRRPRRRGSRSAPSDRGRPSTAS